MSTHVERHRAIEGSLPMWVRVSLIGTGFPGDFGIPDTHLVGRVDRLPKWSCVVDVEEQHLQKIVSESIDASAVVHDDLHTVVYLRYRMLPSGLVVLDDDAFNTLYGFTPGEYMRFTLLHDLGKVGDHG